jgi:NAD(P)-dependent dehydrogenase (short-subunit alcohol dehydrogenase family)
MQTNAFCGKVVLITGGGSGIGLRCAIRLLRAGANIAVFDLEPNNEWDQPHITDHQVLTIAGNAADATALRSAVDQVMARFGRLDLAINAAGITGQLAPILDQTDDGMDRLLAINVRGVFLSMKHEALAMMRSGGGAIVNLASVYSTGSHPKMVLYGATKHAVVGLTQGAAVEWAPHGIRVNAVAPGPIRTPFIGEVTPEIEEAVRRGIPQRRIGDPEEVASAILWLLSTDASYVTGANLSVDGGQAAMLAGG